MDIYVLNSGFDRTNIIDEYVSMIWTERYASVGDFKLEVLPEAKWKSLLVEGRYLGTEGSNRVQIIESVEETEKEGIKLLTVSGRTLECLLEDRVVLQEGVYYVATQIGVIINDVVQSAYGYQDGSERNPAIVFSTAPVTAETDYDRPVSSAYDAAQGLASIGDCGIRMVPSGDKISFEIYTGTRRSSLIFSTQTDTLSDTSTLRSTKDYKNIARVKYKQADGKANWMYIAAPGVDPNIYGFGRKVMNVDAMDIDHPSLQTGYLTNMVRTKALIELAKHQKVNLFTGTVIPSTGMRYNQNYFLGDIGRVMSDDGSLSQDVRITEYIFASDAEGDRNYPTFALVE